MDVAKFLASHSAKTILENILKAKLFRKSLEANGYKIRELPGIGFLDIGSYDRNLFFGTNAILSEKFAIVPNNLFPTLDKEIARIYQTLGYEVIPMKSASESILFHGGTRCASETCRRPYLPVRY